MDQTADASINSAIDETQKLITRQRAVISERAAVGMPAEALGPVLKQIESNLHLLSKVQRFMEAQQRHAPRRVNFTLRRLMRSPSVHHATQSPERERDGI